MSELSTLIEELTSSKIQESNELGVTLLSAPDLTLEDKLTLIENFIKEYNSKFIEFNTPEKKFILEGWSTLLKEIENEIIKQNRIIKI